MIFIPKIVRVQAAKPYLLYLVYETGEEKLFDVAPYICGTWYGELQNTSYFRGVKIIDDGEGIAWPHGQDLAPHELYELSKPKGELSCQL